MAESLGAESAQWCIVLIVVERDGSLVLVAEPTRQNVPCTNCGQLSQRQHSSHERHALDLPWRGHTVRLRVRSRRWFCECARLPTRDLRWQFGPLRSAHTSGTTRLLTAFALQAGGEGGARLARKAGVPISPDTLLRLLHALADDDEQQRPRVLGVQYQPDLPGYTKPSFDAEQLLVSQGMQNVTLGVYSKTEFSTTGGSANTAFLDGLNDIIVTRCPFSDSDQLVTNWRTAAGDQVRKDFPTHSVPPDVAGRNSANSSQEEYWLLYTRTGLDAAGPIPTNGSDTRSAGS